MRDMRNALRGITTFVVFVVGFSLFLELGERYHWVDPVYIGLVVAYLLLGSLVQLSRAARYGDFKGTSLSLWLSWQAWRFPGSSDNR
jgi:hypothetical protein